MTYVVPEDRTRAIEEFASVPAKPRFEVECRIVRFDNKAVRWISAIGEVVRDKFGEPTRMMGTVSDITARREQDEQRIMLSSKTEREHLRPGLLKRYRR